MIGRSLRMVQHGAAESYTATRRAATSIGPGRELAGADPHSSRGRARQATQGDESVSTWIGSVCVFHRTDAA